MTKYLITYALPGNKDTRVLEVEGELLLTGGKGELIVMCNRQRAAMVAARSWIAVEVAE